MTIKTKCAYCSKEIEISEYQNKTYHKHFYEFLKNHNRFFESVQDRSDDNKSLVRK